MSQPAASSPKVLIVDLSNKYGGSSSRVLSLMARAKPGTVALASLKHGAITGQALQLGLPVHVVAAHKADPRLLLRLIQVIRRGGYTLLDSQNIQSKFWASMAAMLTRTALVSTLNSWYANEHGKASIKGRIYTALELLTNQSLDLYITVSEKDRQSLLKSGLTEEAIELIYNAVDVNISEIPGDGTWLRQKFDLPAEALVCTAVGRLVPVKGYDVLIGAMRKIASQVPQLVCLIVGEGECREELSEQIRAAGLEGRVRLLGYYARQDAMSILKSSDIFVMPSRYEGTPIALLEAAALARPILASCTGGIPELVTDEEHALLVPPGDPDALAQGLAKLALDRAYAQTLAQNARHRVQQSFSLESQVAATWNAYQKALDRHRTREH
ncbi:MAG TPA: glycosyltransferase family 4 protein [Anaerolineales bacterium]|nr:glycosyltransferase family 4 protein [Anaerolineales bacterium]